ncbi:hypothetical protein [Enorma massiliensis]|uniref:hypothetical protein n=1 Tax=Enorma massiliensis TaxID=1472761 RepID=UPI0013A6718A|nr:hypothetical protein [Enorma massiliensis]
MADKNQKEFALQKAVELTGKALESTDNYNPIVDPESAVEFLESVYKKLVELQEGK